jgi:hypothetical protein
LFNPHRFEPFAAAQYYTRISSIKIIMIVPTDEEGKVKSADQKPGAPENPEGFSMEQSFNNSYTQLKTTTQVPGAKEKSVMVNYYNQQGHLYRTVDSSENAITIYEYGYSTEGKMVTIVNTSRSSEDKLKATESHSWSYNEKGFPEKMIRVRENADTMEIRLVVDEKGNVTEEQSIRKGVAGDKVYYYYDVPKRLILSDTG